MGMNRVEMMVLSQTDNPTETARPKKRSKAPFRAHGRSGYSISFCWHRATLILQCVFLGSIFKILFSSLFLLFGFYKFAKYTGM